MKRQKLKPAAFMSYVHSDDNRGRLTEFRERLGDEVRVQIGEEFLIFQDRKDISWGVNWKKRINESLDEVTFLIPIITPSFFKSPACRDELQRFLEREKELERDDLVLPIYYVDCPLLNDEEKRAADELAQAIFDHQYADWRELRFEPFTSPQIGKTLARLAVQIRDALERVQASEKPEVPKSAASVVRRQGDGASVPLPQDIEYAIERGGLARSPAAKTEPPIRVVDPMHREDHATITEAIEAANPGDRILVRPGLYQEGLVIDKPGLEIIGDGNLDDVVVQAVGMDALLFKTTMGRVVNLTLRQMDGAGYGVDIAQGRLELDGCDITSQSLICVAIHSGADPRLRRNRIHDGEIGVSVHENGQGILEDNEIHDNAISGVAIETGGNPTLRHNRIHDGEVGVFVHENGQGVLEDNDIFGNALSGVAIIKGGNPTLRRNRIHDGKGKGVIVYKNGQGVLEDNEIYDNTLSGVVIETGGNPTLRRNRIHNSKQIGVFVHENGQGVLEDNNVFGNAVGVAIIKGGNPTLRHNRINKNDYWAVSVINGGGGTIENNDLRDNAKGAWDIAPDSEPNLRRARNKE
jgi:F-box protein 11